MVTVNIFNTTVLERIMLKSSKSIGCTISYLFATFCYMSRDIPIKFHYYLSSLVESPKHLRGSQIPFYNSLKVFRTISLLFAASPFGSSNGICTTIRRFSPQFYFHLIERPFKVWERMLFYFIRKALFIFMFFFCYFFH